MSNIQSIRERRKKRLRYRIKQRAANRPRLSVFRSNKHIYAQIIDDQQRRTLVSASTIDKELVEQNRELSMLDKVKSVGRLLAQRATTQGISKVIFDRGYYLYHGKIKALAETAREGGLSF